LRIFARAIPVFSLFPQPTNVCISYTPILLEVLHLLVELNGVNSG